LDPDEHLRVLADLLFDVSIAHQLQWPSQLSPTSRIHSRPAASNQFDERLPALLHFLVGAAKQWDNLVI
jgi:hypothetical protein